MKKPQQFRRRDRKEGTPASTVSPWKERLIVAACLAGLMGILALIGTMMGIGAQRQALDKQLSKWKKIYHLTEEQAVRIREIELEFHGNGNPFTSRVSGTEEEDAAHHLEISRVMNPPVGERFLSDVRRNGKAH